MDDIRHITPTRHSGSDVSNASFQVVRRGYDIDEVKAYLDGVAREISLLERRLAEAQNSLAEAQRRADNPQLDEQQLIAMLGRQTGDIMRMAHEEGARIVAEAQERATQIFTQSQERATQYLVDAQARSIHIVNEAESAAAAKDEEARQAAIRLEETARVNGDAIISRAREQQAAIIEQANAARKQILQDLTVKRQALNVQIERLRAARDRLTESVSSVRESVEQVLGGLMTSDESARAAAIEALRTARPQTPPSEEELLAGVPLREVPEAETVPLDDVVPSATVTSTEAPTPIRPRIVPDPAPAPAEESDEKVAPPNDVVRDIFARLREATDESKGREVQPRRAPKPRPEPTTADGDLFLRREEAVANDLAELTRHVKRAMQDDQNVMLDRLRNVKGMILDELEDESAQRSRYADAARDVIRKLAESGAAFARGIAPVEGTISDWREADECARDLAVTLTVALRKRIMADGSGEGSDRANIAYREWRGARVERLCGDIARRAFNVGVVAACTGNAVRVIVAPDHQACDACALDAASGSHQVGTRFPSGKPHPPLHAGCNCAVVPG